MDKERIEQVAEVAHETIRAACWAAGDRTVPTWYEANAWMRVLTIQSVEKQLVHRERFGHFPDAAATHDNWRMELLKDGWKWGPVKDAEKKEHPCLVMYQERPFEQRVKDHLFAAVVRAFYECEREGVSK